MMLFWTVNEQRIYRLPADRAHDWDERAISHGLIVDDSPKWAGICNEFMEYYWASVRRGRARVDAGVFHSGREPTPARMFELPPEVYFLVSFRVNDANRELAETLVRAVCGPTAECVGRSQQRRIGKPVILDRAAAR